MIPLTEIEIDAFAKTGYLLRDTFLPENKALQLRDLLKDRYQRNEFKQATIGHPQNRQENSNIRGDQILWLTASGEHEIESFFLTSLNSLMTQLRRELYLPLKWIEAHYAFYDSRQGYQKHYDNFKGGNARILTFVYYLNQNWTHADGGELALYDPEKPNVEILKIEPLLNRLVVFRSDLFPHEVFKAHKERLSLTGWMRSDVEPTFT